ncbi:MAG: type II secretion system protein GspL [Gammaproteobacteria bacterium]
MADQLIVRILSAPFAPLHVDWALFRAREVILGPRVGDLQQMVDGVQDVYHQRPLLRVSCLIPAEWVTLTSTPMPSVQPKVLNKALPFALEEQLAEDVDDLHFSILGKPRPDNVEVAVINRGVLNDWLDALREVGFIPQEMVPDALCLPYGEPDHWGLVLKQDRTLLRTGRHSALAFTSTQIPVMLDAVFDEIGAAQAALKLTLMNEKDEVVSGRVLDALASEIESSEVEVPITLERRHITQPVLQLFAQTLMNLQAERQVPNLLVGDFKQEVTRQKLNVRWKPLAAVLALWFVMQMSVYVVQGKVYEARLLEAEVKAVSAYMRFFPTERNVTAGTLRRRLEAKLRGGEGGQSAGFLPALSAVGEQIFRVDGGKRQTIQLRRVTYEGQSGELKLEMSLSDFEVMSRLKAGIEQKGAEVEEDAANRSNDGRIMARIRVRGL